MPRHDVAIYAPYASQLYEDKPVVSGGAERQTVLLAAGLAERGRRVAHIVLPVEKASAELPEGVRLVQREPFAAREGRLGPLAEIRRLWRAMAEADASVYVVRGGWPALGVFALFCRRHRRKLIFSSAHDYNFNFELLEGKRPDTDLYRLGVRWSHAVVVQSRNQGELARSAFPKLKRVVEIPSFALPAQQTRARPEAFLWAGALTRFKHPQPYLELARAVPEARFWMIPKPIDGEADFGEEMLAEAHRLPNVEVLEARPHAEAMQLMERAVAVVNTSPAEGMPNMFLEAWARGVPALAFEFDPDGRVEQLGLGWAARGSPESFAEGARKLWEGREDRAELSAHVRSYIEQTHLPPVVTERWARLIEEVGGGR